MKEIDWRKLAIQIIKAAINAIIDYLDDGQLNDSAKRFEE
jgi:hypothetical protein